MFRVFIRRYEWLFCHGLIVASKACWIDSRARSGSMSSKLQIQIGTPFLHVKRLWRGVFAMNVNKSQWVLECRQTLTKVFGPLKSGLHRIINRLVHQSRASSIFVSSWRLPQGKCGESDRKPNDVSINIYCARDAFVYAEFRVQTGLGMSLNYD